ncbi:MAG: P-II family nitrogen regulator [Nitrospinota bacterium]|nr:P-II family nitrogen regulator [Nitrospinota bacterium]MDH5756145.1 P-II family nitrogen regulator [Nitrospinota bacterium]
MEEKEIFVLTDVSLITCIVQRGLADIVVNAATDAGAQGGTVYFARGYGIRERLGTLGVAIEAEKEVIMIVVSDEQADRVFERIYTTARLSTPGMGIMFVSRLEKAATYIPPEVIANMRRNRRKALGENG